MKTFDEYVTEIERRHKEAKREKINGELLQRAERYTHEEAFALLCSELTFIIGVSEILPLEEQKGGILPVA